MKKHYAVGELVKKELKLDMLRDQLDDMNEGLPTMRPDALMVTLIESEIKDLEDDIELLVDLMGGAPPGVAKDMWEETYNVS